MMQPQEAKEPMLALASAISPFTSWLTKKIWIQAAHQVCWDCHLQSLCLARSFSAPRLEATFAHLMYYGAEDLASLRFILEQDLDLAALRYDTDLGGQLHLAFQTPQL